MLQDSLALMPLWAFVAAMGVTLVRGLREGRRRLRDAACHDLGAVAVHRPADRDRRDHPADHHVEFPAGDPLRLARDEAATREYWRYILIVCLAIVIVAQFVTNVPTQTFYLVLGVPVVILS
jgi:hypothetical protein